MAITITVAMHPRDRGKLTRDAGFDESKHKRDHGKFTSASSSGAPHHVSRNEGYGFHGAIGSHHRDQAQAFAVAHHVIRAKTNADSEHVRKFLDSVHGRHFADQVKEHMDQGHSLSSAVGQVADRHLQQRLGQREARRVRARAGTSILHHHISQAARDSR